MGIQGIYKEIGPGERIALSKLAVQKFEETGRPLRIAIDISIWLFQIQASKGGSNPALRTFFYRLLRLISLSINPIFVFDGPNKPPFKRNNRTGPNVASIPEFLAKQLLKQFGFPIHLAPGEAEAECALLQREGIVDAVLSEDVDTLMFGSGITLRNWSPEAKSTSKTPTHVNLYDAVKTKDGPSGLDRDGMILVAMMSGGDYIPEGIPGCGPKTACEAARAGFGRDLCNIARNDSKALEKWKARLCHELKTNENKHFTRKHKALIIPEEFPRTDILRYYTHPAISPKTALDRLERSIEWDQSLDFNGLRAFTGDAFDWTKLGGAKHFVRNLAPALLVRHLRIRGQKDTSADVEKTQQEEAKLVKSIHGKRNHPDTDNSTELRIAFTPLELVSIDLSKEEPDDGLPEVDPDDEVPLEDVDGEDASSAPRKRGPTTYDPEKPQRVWVMETYVRVGVPLKVQDWEESFRNPKKFLAMKHATKAASNPKPTRTKKSKETTMPKGALDRFAKVTKPGVDRSHTAPAAQGKDDETERGEGKTITPAPCSLPLSILSSPNQPIHSNVIELLSSPVGNFSPPVSQRNTKALSPRACDRASSNVTKRRRRGPIQRSQTLPAHPSASQDQLTISPALSPAIEMLDLVDSPRLLSKKSRITQSQLPFPSQARSIPTTPKKTSKALPTSAASGRRRQHTLDDWVSPSTTCRIERPPSSTLELPLSPLQSHRNGPELLDLTISSPIKPLPQTSVQPTITTSRRRPATSAQSRPVLHSVSSNASRISNESATSKPPAPHRTRTPPIPKPTSAPPTLEIESLDLTTPPPTSTSQSHHLSVSTPPRRSPRGHTSSESPPAPWRLRKEKKRAVVLRKSVAGAWDFIDIEALESEKEGVDWGRRGGIGQEKERRRWRESQIEIVDLVE